MRRTLYKRRFLSLASGSSPGSLKAIKPESVRYCPGDRGVVLVGDRTATGEDARRELVISFAVPSSLDGDELPQYIRAATQEVTSKSFT